MKTSELLKKKTKKIQNLQQQIRSLQKRLQNQEHGHLTRDAGPTVRAVADVFGVSTKIMFSKERCSNEASIARHTAMALLQDAGWKCDEVAAAFNRGSTTMHYARKTLKNMSDISGDYRAKLAHLRTLLPLQK